jgi:hypothetical protein
MGGTFALNKLRVASDEAVIQVVGIVKPVMADSNVLWVF